MSESVNVYEAKTHLSQLLDRAAAGEEIVIARAGRPIARLVPLADSPSRPRSPGGWRGKVRISDDFDELPAEIGALQAQIRVLHGRLADPGFYERDRKGFEAASAALTSAEKDLTVAEERWLELEILREDVAGR